MLLIGLFLLLSIILLPLFAVIHVTTAYDRAADDLQQEDFIKKYNGRSL
ncbi:hypothetical protein [Novisyntrophococcus fermenticellae]|nr:hypothetical protein [Novisyntrophococcus fermenticellae]